MHILLTTKTMSIILNFCMVRILKQWKMELELKEKYWMFNNDWIYTERTPDRFTSLKVCTHISKVDKAPKVGTFQRL